MSKGLGLLLLLGAVLAAGCGTTASTPGAAAHVTRASGTAASASRPFAGTPQRRADAEAKAILGEFAVPPGAVRLAARPRLPGGSATMGLSYSTTVHATGYWRVRGAATALLAWEKAHVSRSFSRRDVIIGPPDWNTVYTLPAVAGRSPRGR